MDTSPRVIARRILKWSEEHPRWMPWKETKDPYKIWLSEIILQQTQVSQGIPYYERFTKHFPDVETLAAASEDEVLKEWQGLGYNSRARHLHYAAKIIVNEYRGRFPQTYAEIRALKGIGDYTAAAIASFAYGFPTPVLDSNVIRVVCRIFGIEDLVGSKDAQHQIYVLLREMMHGHDPALFNQAMMNFGAMQCVARVPACNACLLSSRCAAFHQRDRRSAPSQKSKAGETATLLSLLPAPQ